MSTNPIKKSYYEILGVPEDASQEEIKKARDRRVKEYHPDLHPNHLEWATERTKELNEAYEILSNPQKRAEYDEYLSHPPTVQPPPARSPIPVITPSHIDLGLVEIGRVVQKTLTIENRGGPCTKDPDLRLSPADSWLRFAGYKPKSENEFVVQIEIHIEDDMIPGQIYQGEVTVDMDGVTASASIMFKAKVKTATDYSPSSTIPSHIPAPTYYRTSSSRHSLINVASIAIWPALALFIIFMILNIVKATPKEPVNVVIQIQPEDHLVSKNNGSSSDMYPNVFVYSLFGICNIDSTPIHSTAMTHYKVDNTSSAMESIGVYKIPWTVETNIDPDRYEKVIGPNLKLVISVPLSSDSLPPEGWVILDGGKPALNCVFLGRIRLTLLDIRNRKDPKTVADLAICEDGKIYQATSPIPSSWVWHFEQFNVLMEDSQFGQNSVHLKYRGFARGITVSFVQTETVRASDREGIDWVDSGFARSFYEFICPAGQITISF